MSPQMTAEERLGAMVGYGSQNCVGISLTSLSHTHHVLTHHSTVLPADLAHICTLSPQFDKSIDTERGYTSYLLYWMTRCHLPFAFHTKFIVCP
jgi:hypothetical protein